MRLPTALLREESEVPRLDSGEHPASGKSLLVGIRFNKQIRKMTQEKKAQLLNKLNLIIKEKNNRKKLIEEFQQSIWDSDSNNIEYEILSELAYDLDYYEPNEQSRKEHSSYYGEEHLIKEIESAINKIKSIGDTS